MSSVLRQSTDIYTHGHIHTVHTCVYTTTVTHDWERSLFYLLGPTRRYNSALFICQRRHMNKIIFYRNT